MGEPVTSLYIGENSIRIINAQFNNGQIKVNAFTSQEEMPLLYTTLTEKTINEVASLIDKSFSSLRLNNKNVNIVIPDTLTYSQIQEMPKLKEKELLSAIKYQADQFIPLPLDEASLDLEILNEDAANKKLIVLIVAASEKLISQLTTLVEASGLIPLSIENELSSIGRLLSQCYKPKDKSGGIIYVNIGFSTSSIYYYNPALGLITDTHAIKSGIELFVKELRANINIDSKKAFEILKTIGLGQNGSVNINAILSPAITDFLREVEKFVISTKEKYNTKITQVNIINNAYKVALLENKVAEYLSIPTSIFDVAPYIQKDSVSSAMQPSQLSSFVSSLGGCLR